MSADARHTFYRYEGLLLAIEYFSQRFSLDQLAVASFEFVNELLTLRASALFVRDGDQFVLSQKRLYAVETMGDSIADSPRLRRLATFHGQVLQSGFDQYFDTDVMERYRLRLVIPLLIDDVVHGFILSDGKIIGDFQEDDTLIAVTLMRLINNALENSKRLAVLQQINTTLDQKIFNLFAINQSTKALLSEISMNKLHEIATDIFSEISSSKVTAFGTYDELSGKIKMTGYRNVASFKTRYTEFTVKPGATLPRKVVLHLEEDWSAIEELFVNPGDLDLLGARYAVLIISDRLTGMVTLSEPVSDRIYDEATFELIESLAAATCIAITNASLFDKLSRQEETAQKKLRMLSSLNKLVRNIKTCTTPQDVCRFTLKTLQATFGIRKAWIGFLEDDVCHVRYSLGLPGTGEDVHQARDSSRSATASERAVIMAGSRHSAPGPYLASSEEHRPEGTGWAGTAVLAEDSIPEEIAFTPPPAWQAALDGETIYAFTAESAASYFPAQLRELWGPLHGCMICPLTPGTVTASLDEPVAAGFLVVLETKDTMKEEDLLLLDTMAHNIAPVLHQMSVTDSIRARFVEDPRKAFTEALYNRIDVREQFGIPFFLYYTRIQKHPFRPFTLPPWLESFETFVIDDVLLVFTDEPQSSHIPGSPPSHIPPEQLIQIPEAFGPDDILAYEYPG
ncbi:GAF domain-containing protein [Paenibacillus sp. y28]|uniref:GAF domain-containing protein n=1 Tax=Paenibacillus sp. y28 TaxID=3129110 RepID=UPI003019C60A